MPTAPVAFMMISTVALAVEGKDIARVVVAVDHVIDVGGLGPADALAAPLKTCVAELPMTTV
jgi:hypothetical protein